MSTKPIKTSFPFTESQFFFWTLIIFIIIFRFYQTQPTYHLTNIIRISGYVRSEPIRYDTAQSVKLAGLKAYLPRYPEIDYGDFIVIEGAVGEKGKLLKPVLINHQTSTNFLYQTRKQIINEYRQILPEPHSSLVVGVVLGAKSSIPEDFWQALKKTGTAHVVVASGMNVTLVAGFLMNFLVTIINRKKAIIFALLGIWLYTMLSGFDAPLVRAAIMGSIAFSAQGLGKLYSAWRALFLSAALMLIFTPSWLTDLGFILSFLATASLMLFESKINRLISFIPNPFREGLATSLAAQIGVAPILYLTFGQLSILSPLINGLLLWTIPLITIIGGMGAIASLIHPILSLPFIYAVYPLTSWFIFVVNLFSSCNLTQPGKLLLPFWLFMPFSSGLSPLIPPHRTMLSSLLVMWVRVTLS